MIINLSVIICVICGELKVAGCGLRFLMHHRVHGVPQSFLFIFWHGSHGLHRTRPLLYEAFAHLEDADKHPFS